MLIFEERGKLENPEKNLSEQSKEPTTNLTHTKPEPGHVGGRRVQSPLRHPCSPLKEIYSRKMLNHLAEELHMNVSFLQQGVWQEQA